MQTIRIPLTSTFNDFVKNECRYNKQFIECVYVNKYLQQSGRMDNMIRLRELTVERRLRKTVPNYHSFSLKDNIVTYCI